MQREHQEIPSTAERLLEAIVWHGSLMDCKALVRIHGSPAIITGPSESPDQRSPLHWAVLYNREEIVEWFLEQHPVGIDNVDAEGCTPLTIAILQGEDKIVELLLREGANLESVSEIGLTPLQLAGQVGHERVLRAIRARRTDNERVGASVKPANDSRIRFPLSHSGDPREPQSEPLEGQIDMEAAAREAELAAKRDAEQEDELRRVFDEASSK
eukprot:m.68155 g.68155  ORF g.68155 m.68155 type:complete len:214 (-) comp50002_c0_seq5:103-744(-)